MISESVKNAEPSIKTMTRHGIIARTKALDKGDSVREALEHCIKKACVA